MRRREDTDEEEDEAGPDRILHIDTMEGSTDHEADPEADQEDVSKERKAEARAEAEAETEVQARTDQLARSPIVLHLPLSGIFRGEVNKNLQ